jgi:hypothetical protein
LKLLGHDLGQRPELATFRGITTAASLKQAPVRVQFEEVPTFELRRILIPLMLEVVPPGQKAERDRSLDGFELAH